MTEVRERLRRAHHQVTPPDRAFERMLERRDRKRRHERVAAATASLVMGVAVIASGLALLSGLLGERIKPASEGTGQIDARLVLDPGEYFYVAIRSSEATDGHIRNEETWWALDGSGEVRNNSTRQDKYPLPATGVYGAGGFPAQPFAGEDVARLSTDPASLAAQLQTKRLYTDILVGSPEPERTWRLITTLLLDYPNVTPDLRAALYEVAVGLKDVRRTKHVEDPRGRTATALTFASDEDPIEWTAYFDPDTRQLKAWTWVYQGDKQTSGWVVLESAIVDAPGEQPTPDQWLFPPNER